MSFLPISVLCLHCLPSAEFLNPAYQALPGFLASRNYEGSPTDPTDTAVQMAFDSKGKDLIGILMERPDSARGFGTLMSTWGEGHSLIQDLYPVNERLPKGFDDSHDSVMFVDVGGGYGQKAIALKRACPELPGRFIVQDLPGTVANAPNAEGIEMMGHDFFTEQPVKGTSSLSTDGLVQLKILYRCPCLLHPAMSPQLAHRKVPDYPQTHPRRHETGLLQALRTRTHCG